MYFIWNVDTLTPLRCELVKNVEHIERSVVLLHSRIMEKSLNEDQMDLEEPQKQNKNTKNIE